MNTMTRLGAPALIALLFAQGAFAADSKVASFTVSPDEADPKATVTFKGTVGVVTATDADAPAACLDTSGDGGCASPPPEVLACSNAGKVWVYVTGFEGTGKRPSLYTGVCASSKGTFSGTLTTGTVTARTRIDLYASLWPLSAPPVADPMQTWLSASYYVDLPLGIASLACTPAQLSSGAQATATVTTTRPTTTAQTIELSGSSSYTSAPKSVTIPVGATTATFQVTAGKAPADSDASVKAANKASSQTCTIKILKAG